MSMPPEPPERLAEILLEILALSNSSRMSESKSIQDSDPIESFEAHSVQEQSQRRDERDNRQEP